MFFALLIAGAELSVGLITGNSTLTPTSATKSAPAPTASMFDIVLQRMSLVGRPIFRQYLDRTLLPRIRADNDVERAYRVALRQVVSSATPDIDAAERMIDTRRRAEAALATAIRSSAFAMIRSLPLADRKLALTAIFADARAPLSRTTTPASVIKK